MRIAERADEVNLPEAPVWIGDLRTPKGAALRTNIQMILAPAASTRVIRRYVPGVTDRVAGDLCGSVRGNALAHLLLSMPSGRSCALCRLARLFRPTSMTATPGSSRPPLPPFSQPMPASPRVSVVTSVYNEMPWLPVAIESVLAQTFSDFEFLLVDDGSKNGCPETLADYAGRDGRIRVITKPNGGQVSGLNRGLAEARGEYVARLDADDIMYPTRIEKQVAYLDAHPRVALVGSQVDWAAKTGTTRWSTPTEVHLARWTLLVENCFMGGGVTFRTDAVRAVGGYRATFEYTEDYDLWDRLAERYDVVNLPETLAWFNSLRTTNGSTIHAEKQDLHALTIMERSIRRYVPGATSDAIADIYHVGRHASWPNGAPPRALARLADAARLLARLRAAFESRHSVPPAACAAIAADASARLMRIRRALSAQGGVGHLGRLSRPNWDPKGRFLLLPSLLNRS